MPIRTPKRPMILQPVVVVIVRHAKTNATTVAVGSFHFSGHLRGCRSSTCICALLYKLNQDIPQQICDRTLLLLRKLLELLVNIVGDSQVNDFICHDTDVYANTTIVSSGEIFIRVEIL